MRLTLDEIEDEEQIRYQQQYDDDGRWHVVTTSTFINFPAYNRAGFHIWSVASCAPAQPDKVAYLRMMGTNERTNLFGSLRVW